MTFDLKHWKDPRATIANEFQHNDFGYLAHGNTVSATIIKELNRFGFNTVDLENKKALDFGCGTGRITIMAQPYFSRIVGYDPVTECIEQAEIDKLRAIGKMCKFDNLFFTTSLDGIPDSEFDVVYAVNVLEHLDAKAFKLAIQQIIRVMREDGVALLWYHEKKNPTFSKIVHFDKSATTFVRYKVFTRPELLRIA